MGFLTGLDIHHQRIPIVTVRLSLQRGDLSCKGFQGLFQRPKLLLFGEKDALLESHGRLLCRREELEALDRGFLVGVRRGQYSTEALIRRRQEFRRRYPQLTVEPATLEDIMVFTEKGEAVCGD